MFTQGFSKQADPLGRLIGAAIAPSAGAIIGLTGYNAYKASKKPAKKESASQERSKKELAAALGTLGGFGVSAYLVRKAFGGKGPTNPNGPPKGKKVLPDSAYKNYPVPSHPAIVSRRKNLVKVDFSKKNFIAGLKKAASILA